MSNCKTTLVNSKLSKLKLFHTSSEIKPQNYAAGIVTISVLSASEIDALIEIPNGIIEYKKAAPAMEAGFFIILLIVLDHVIQNISH